MVDRTEALLPVGRATNEGSTAPATSSDQAQSRLEHGIANVHAKLTEVDDRLSRKLTTMCSTISEALSVGNGFRGGGAHGKSGYDLTPEQRVRKSDAELAGRAAAEADLRKQIADLEADVARLRARETQFREIILSSAGTQKVTDQDVTAAFSSPRQKAQQIAQSPIFDLTNISRLRMDNRKIPVHEEMERFYDLCRNLQKVDVHRRIKAKIFNILDTYIFSITCFGLKRSDTAGNKNTMWELEDGLVDFDAYLYNAKKGALNESVLADWRICTMQCIDQLKLPEEYSTFVAGKIRNFFFLLIPQQIKESEDEEYWLKLLELCQQAITLKRMMQLSKEGYAITYVKGKELFSKSDLLAEPMGVEDGRNADKTDVIAYMLFGGLSKPQSESRDGRKILEKAEVILKSKSPPALPVRRTGDMAGQQVSVFSNTSSLHRQD
ncbi:MAG: hypothetical protein M1822_004442 [Bathelium mastoideum]|nr:MAG: hypothetical protein M1822_004442 [Bathelium mastoideum]